MRGEGCGIVVLKRLSDAQADGDPILAVIRGSAVNHNGRGAGLMVPSSTAQEAVIRLALAEAGVKPEAVGFIEGQGTATLLGDSVELRTLAALFGKDRLPGRPLYLGSVKTNVGHLEVAAGMAGLIKTVLALRHRAIPPNLHFQQPNPHLAWQETPLQVPTALLPWMQENGPRVAGVSAFSISGTNAHVVLEEAPSCPAPVQTLDRPVHLLCLSARTPAALKQLAAAVGENLSAPTAGKLPDASFTVNCGRRHFPHRVAVVADEQMKAARALALFAGGAQVEGLATSQVTRRGAPRIALLFSPWISANWSPGAGRQLFQTCPPFRNALQEIAALADPLSGRSLLSDMYPEPAGGANGSPHPPMSLVARFALQVALVRLWRGWGIQPTLYVGHGLSAYAAAAAAGVFPLVDGLKLALLLEQFLPGNPPERLVQPIPETVVTSLGRVTAEIAFSRPDVALLTGTGDQFIRPDEMTSATFWASLVREPVRFGETIAALQGRGYDTVLEIGVGATLPESCVCGPVGAGLRWLSTLRPECGDWPQVLETLQALYLAGCTIDWKAFDAPYPRRWCWLPNYPFQRKRYWLDAPGHRRIDEPVQPENNGHEQVETLSPRPLWRELSAAPPSMRRDMLEESLVAELAAVMQVLPEEIDRTLPLLQMGLDSLMAVELRGRLERDLERPLPIAMLLDNPSLEQLADRVLALLDALPEERLPTAADTALPPIVSSPAPAPEYPLSRAQEIFWTLEQLQPQTALNHNALAFRWRGPLDRTVLQESFRDLFTQHDSLRTTFHIREGQPVQRVSPLMDFRVDVIDLSDVEAGEREAEALRRASKAAHELFELSQGPLLRVRFFRLAEEDYLGAFVAHHIVADGWSLGVLWRDLAALYQGRLEGRPSLVRSLAVQYGDYVLWQSKPEYQARLGRQLNYWKQQLAGAPPTLELPTDRPRPAVWSGAGGVHTTALSANLREAVERFSREEGVTPFVTLFAAFQVLLARYSGQTDFCIGVPSAGRGRPELMNLIGAFVNPLVLRSSITGRLCVRDLVRRVRQTVVEAHDNADISLTQLVEELRPVRVPQRMPWYQVMFVYQNLPVLEVDWQGIEIIPRRLDVGTTPFDLVVDVFPTAGELVVDWQYSTLLFEPSTISRLHQHWVHLLEAMVTRPDQDVWALPLLGEGERRQVLVEWNQTAAAYPQDLCLHELFEAQVARSPEAVAVVCGEQQWTYAELNAQANRLAHHLRTLGVGPEVRVGICVERSLAMMAGLLGILKAGGAYVPLDPEYPPERLAFVVQDAHIPVLLTQAHLSDHLRSHLPHVICLDVNQPDIALQPDHNPPTLTTPENLAYLIYTSGSTGRQKGVAVPHRAVANHSHAMTKIFGLTAQDRVLQFATITFDTSVEEIFPTWFSGAALVLRPDRAAPSETELRRLVEQGRLTVLDLPTSYWDFWVGNLGQRDAALPDSLRLIIVGGEAASLETLQRWYQVPGTERMRWLNTYGPTESTVVTTWWEANAARRNRKLFR